MIVYKVAREVSGKIVPMFNNIYNIEYIIGSITTSPTKLGLFVFRTKEQAKDFANKFLGVGSVKIIDILECYVEDKDILQIADDKNCILINEDGLDLYGVPKGTILVKSLLVKYIDESIINTNYRRYK